jgi:hypothetical protein
MGLLDDAIREHLELKRLRGADPGLVAREARDAFGPAREGEQADTDDDVATLGDLVVESDRPAEDDLTRGSQADQVQGHLNVGQETAELDMRTLLDDESDRDAAPVAVGPLVGRSPSVDASLGQGDDDSLEWEMPADGASGNADKGDLRDDDLASQQDEPVEDVLEETPDFLRDTPEQERLWFEQRPPRDFDFDK